MFFHSNHAPWLSPASLADSGAVIYGAGGGGHLLGEFFSRSAVPVRAFLDNYRHGGERLGRPVFPAGRGPAELGLSADLPVIISVVNFAAYNPAEGAETCRRSLREAGWKNVATRPEWLAALFFAQRERLAFVENLWADEKSRRLYRQALDFLATRADEHEPAVQPDAYFPDDVPGPRNQKRALRWVQGGAYTGDTLEQALSLGLKIEEAAFFEPEEANYRRLAAYARKAAGEGGGRLSCWPLGLWSGPAALRFHTGAGTDSAVEADGDGLIQSVDLDSALPGFRPNLITLDIEGAEREALEGMKNTIIENRPLLAVSLYHRPDDWWVLPEWLDSLNKKFNLGYGFYIRVHSNLVYDTVIYACPAD